MAKAKAGLAAVAGLIVWCGAASAEDFKVGVVLPMTGPGADIAKNLVYGFNAAVPLINARGGIGGMKVAPVVCDSQSQEQQAILCDRRLLTDEKVDLLLGNGSTPQTLAALPVIEQVGVPLFSMAAGTAIYRPFRKWVFKGLNSNEDQIAVEIEYLKKKGWTHVAIIRDNGPFGADISSIYHEFVKGTGLEIVADEQYTSTDQDMTAQVTRVRALKPDVIVDMAATAPPGALVAKKIVQLGIAAPIIVGTNLQTAGFVALAGDAADQIIYTALKVVLPDLPKSDPLYDNIAAFDDEFHKINLGIEMNGLSPNTADGLMVTQAVAKSLGPRALDHDALRQALETAKDIPGLQGIWTYTPTSHEVSLKDGTALVKYVNGKWVSVQ
ncbi:MAG TPA: ABC transporter substrate-binding protein [Stellaceae bacterium]|nr:ABC transporter substrate-binding protein [Stellaceae bacterium]